MTQLSLFKDICECGGVLEYGFRYKKNIGPFPLAWCVNCYTVWYANVGEGI